MSDIKLYHKDIYLPKYLIEDSLNLQKSTTDFVLSKHVRDNLSSYDRSHKATEDEIWSAIIEMHKNPIEPFEVESTDGNVSKYAVKLSANKSEDIILVVRKNKIITYYKNGKNDNHITLDESKYEKKPKKFIIKIKKS